ncbi:hypothetical protein FS749_015880 [Ceratobasidium sp. UAMH 11750]|nr:hypothetical protein FS749_015880 [Ceratobasidium sp. UAMH 11750]
MPAVASYAPRGQATRNSNRQRPQRVQIFRNDNWPPRPPALDLPVPSFLTPQSPDSDTSLLRALPTPSFVTRADFSDAAMDVERMVEANTNNATKTAPPPVPTKAVIAASAVPLADWFADVVWAIYLGRNSTVATTGGNAGLAGADKAPPALAAFVHAVLSQTLASPQCAALGLYYLVRLPVNLSSVSNLRMGGALWNVGPDAEGHTCYASVPDRERAARAGFVAELYGQGVGPGGEDVPYRLAALALMLGNKWLDDHTFTNKTWHEVTHLPLARLTALEQRALECFNHTLGVADADWRSWLGVLRDEAAHAGAAIVAGGEAIGVSALAVETMERLEKEREVLVYGVGAGVVSAASGGGGKGVIGDRRGSFGSGQTQTRAGQAQPTAHVQPVSEMELDELEMEQVEIDIDLDDGGPVPEELRRPVKVRLGTGAGAVGEGRGWDKAVTGEKTYVAGEKYMLGEKRSAVGDGRDEWERAVKASAGDRFREHWLAGLLEEDDEWTWAREDGWLQWDRERDPPVERVTAARGGYEAVQRPGKKQLFVDENEVRVKGKKELFAVGSEYRGGKTGENVPRVELYDAQLQDVRGGYDQYGGYEHYTYDYPAKGYHPGYEAIPRDAMGYDSGLAYTHGYDCPGYEYAGQCYGGSYVPRQVSVPVWIPQQQPAQHRGSSGCVLS